MNNNGENGKKSGVDKEIADAENLLKKGGQENIDKAWNALTALKQRKSKLSKPQSQKVARVLSSISDKKNEEINANLEKLQKGIEEGDKEIAAGSLSILLIDNRFLSIEQERKLVILKEKYVNAVDLKNNKK